MKIPSILFSLYVATCVASTEGPKGARLVKNAGITSATGWAEKEEFTLTSQAVDRNPKGATWVHPVIANGKMYLRDQEFISCYDVKASK